MFGAKALKNGKVSTLKRAEESAKFVLDYLNKCDASLRIKNHPILSIFTVIGTIMLITGAMGLMKR